MAESRAAGTTEGLAAALAAIMGRVRAVGPLVHYLPNLVTATDAANALLAVGAAPVMAVAVEEVADIAGAALALNLGTPTAERVAAMLAAGRGAAARGVPVVLDPVGVGATPFRMAACRGLLDAFPVAVVRCNAGEAAALLGVAGRARGVDAVGGAADAAALARALAGATGGVAAVTGPVDAVSDGRRTLLVANGHPLLARVTGSGCMLTGVVAAAAAVEPDALRAAAAALLGFGVAGEVAARGAAGPGSFRVALLDALDACDAATLTGMGRVRWGGEECPVPGA